MNNKISNSIIKHKRIVLITFILSSIICALMIPAVSVNYNMLEYLPEETKSTTAINIMNDEFGGRIPNTRVMITNVSIQEALDYKRKISEIEGVQSITWLDDILGLDSLNTKPIEFIETTIVRNYYKENNAIMSLTIESGKEQVAVNAIYDIIGENNAASGEAVTNAEAQALSSSEVVKAMVMLIPIIIIILILTTSSWIEPLLFLFTIGVAVVLNMGTNIFFDEISFITKTVSPILQLAVSLDYAIFLLHSYNGYRSSYEPKEAMVLAIKQAFSTVAASAATTAIGFAALIFMRFGIGSDLGVNLLKGILFSYVSVMVLLPAISLMWYKAIEKTKHRAFIPDFKNSGKILMKVRIPFLILALIVVIPSFLAQSNTSFLYGTGSVTKASRVGKDTLKIEEKFGKENAIVLLIPKGDIGKEAVLGDELSKIPHVTSVISYVTAVGAKVPTEFVPKEVTKQFYSKNYTRIILYTDTMEEGDVAFGTVTNVSNTVATHYEKFYMAGQSATLSDIKNVVSADTLRINLLAVIGIFIVLLITFRSLILPFILLFSIETAIWINLSIPYLTGQSLSFIGYLIVSTVQLGATVDYAILFTNSYLENRKTLPKKEAMKATIGDNLIAILTSGGILSIMGYTLAFTSSNPIISELGTLLGRGTLLSLAMVTFVLPALLVLFDRVIQKTTLKNKFKNDDINLPA